MSQVASGPGESAAPPAAIYRHPLLVRVTHWINALAFLVPSGTGARG